MEIFPSKGLNGVRIGERGKLLRIKGISAVSNLPLSIAHRQRAEGLNILRSFGTDIDIEIISAPSEGRGSFFFIIAEYEAIRAGFSWQLSSRELSSLFSVIVNSQSSAKR